MKEYFLAHVQQPATAADQLPHHKNVDWDNHETAFRMYISYFSLLFDLGVLAFHFSTPYHPKFYVKSTRRRMLRTHITFGCLEIASCVGAFYSKDPTYWSYAAAFFGILAQVPSTFYQIPTVLGIKAFLVPSLFLVTALHGYYAVMLAFNPTSFYYLLSTYMTVHIYAWSRVFFALFYRFKLFEGHRFSAAMLTAGMLLVPSVLGLRGNVILLGFVVVTDVLIKFFYADAEFWKAWTTENPRELTNTPDKKVMLEALITAAEITHTIDALASHDKSTRYARVCYTVMSANMRNLSPRDKARAVFRAIDTDNNNELSISEIREFLLSCGISEQEMTNKLLLESLFENRKVATFDDFCSWFTKHWVHSNTITIPQLPSTPRGQAKLVFDTLDADGSGNLDLAELEYLLVSWGLPKGEAAGYLKAIDTDGSGKIEFQEFYKGMDTIWKFAIQSFIDEGKIVLDTHVDA
ncbi:hypothetical protein BGZ73_002745 [Actinomortierella ambigua]|nr:hypothetical protein BGZ73_002745 [Actinomortierella ambigua]